MKLQISYLPITNNYRIDQEQQRKNPPSYGTARKKNTNAHVDRPNCIAIQVYLLLEHIRERPPRDLNNKSDLPTITVDGVAQLKGDDGELARIKRPVGDVSFTKTIYRSDTLASTRLYAEPFNNQLANSRSVFSSAC